MSGRSARPPSVISSASGRSAVAMSARGRAAIEALPPPGRDPAPAFSTWMASVRSAKAAVPWASAAAGDAAPDRLDDDERLRNDDDRQQRDDERDDDVDERDAAFAAMGCEAMAPRCADGDRITGALDNAVMAPRPWSSTRDGRCRGGRLPCHRHGDAIAFPPTARA